MHSKIINPSLHGKGVYGNKGSSQLLVAYLQHEAREKGVSLAFFHQQEDGVSPQEVQQRIDNNIKGLRNNESRFITLVLSPSAEELQHIGNSPEKLKQFTRAAMQQYAENFRLKGGKKIGGADLLWFAAIHDDRAYKGTSREVREGMKEPNELKPGFNRHVHVIVSKRDRAQMITLSPFGNRDRFDMQAWQRENQWCFNRMFHYYPLEKAGVEQQIGSGKRNYLNTRIAEQVDRINGFLAPAHKLKLEGVLAIAEKRQYHRTFFFNLNRLEQKLKNDGYVREPMHLLENNRDRKRESVRVPSAMAASLKQLLNASRTMGFTEQLGLQEFIPKKRKRLGQIRN